MAAPVGVALETVYLGERCGVSDGEDFAGDADAAALHASDEGDGFNAHCEGCVLRERAAEAASRGEVVVLGIAGHEGAVDEEVRGRGGGGGGGLCHDASRGEESAREL